MEKDAQVERMRGGVRNWLRVRRGGGRALRELSPPALLSLLCASAFGPLVESGAGITGATVVASIGVLSSVGGNVLADVLTGAIDQLRGRGKGSLAERDEIEEVLSREIGAVLARGDATASELRVEIGSVLGQIDASGTMLRAAVESGSERVRTEVVAAIGLLGSEFAELGFLIGDVATTAAKIQQDLDDTGLMDPRDYRAKCSAVSSVRLAREDLAVLERRTRAGVPASGKGPAWEGCPYRGLLPYGEADAEVFYGRERLATRPSDLLASRVQRRGLVVVTGASGAGKSSLLRPAGCRASPGTASTGL